MNRIKALAVLAALLIAAFMAVSPVSALADHGHGYYHDRPSWGHGDIRAFHTYDAHVWRHGHWYHGRYGDHFGWWWIVAGTWYFYPAPIYPYPNPYVPPPLVVQTYPPPAPPPGPAPVQYWYYCPAAGGYYPYVPSCPEGWQRVPVTPSPSMPPR